jgi:hypothetical protein
VEHLGGAAGAQLGGSDHGHHSLPWLPASAHSISQSTALTFTERNWDEKMNEEILRQLLELAESDDGVQVAG